MRIRAGQAFDADSGSEILRRSISELCHADHEGDPDRIRNWIGNKTSETWKLWIGRKDATVYVAEKQARILGVSMMDHVGNIMLNYVSPDDRWRGVSKALLVHMETQALGMGLQRCTLKSTRTARLFYEANGYTPSESEGQMHKWLSPA
ncbi:MAG TPA: GNAT family N-acetyltransferase [Sphingobium sp.]